jgi:hypothetical protein
MDDQTIQPELIDAEPDEFALGTGEVAVVDNLPPWLAGKKLPKKRPFNWPGGAKSPSWFSRMAKCPRNHAQKYRHRRADPSGVDALIGTLIHGALEDAGNIRLNGRFKNVPSKVGPEEVLALLEHQPEAVRQGTELIEGEEAFLLATTEVLTRARAVANSMIPIDLSNIWAAEYIWSFQASAQTKCAGIADLVQVQPDPRGDRLPPIEVVVSDYKTGAMQEPNRETLSQDPQACLQLIWARRNWPTAARVRFQLINVTTGFRNWVDWSPQLEENMLAFARSCVNRWHAKDETALVDTPKCTYCPYRNDCKAYSKELNKAVYKSYEGLEDMDLQQLARLYRELKVVEDLASKRRSDLKALILAQFPSDKKKLEVTGGLEVSKRTRSTTSWRSVSGVLTGLAEQTGQDLSSLIDDTCSITKSKIDGLVKALPADRQDAAKSWLEEMSARGSTLPWIEVREKSPAF